jgi:hypothetical protein
MCNINGPFKLCTCADKVDRTKPHWILHRYLQSKEEIDPDYGFEFRKGKWKMLEPFERYSYSHSMRHFGKIIRLGKTITTLKNTLPFLLLVSLLFACDLKPIDYSKKRRKSSYVSASTTQTGRLRKAHARKSISTSKRAFKNRLNSRSYYIRNKNRRKLRERD